MVNGVKLTVIRYVSAVGRACFPGQVVSVVVDDDDQATGVCVFGDYGDSCVREYSIEELSEINERRSE